MRDIVSPIIHIHEFHCPKEAKPKLQTTISPPRRYLLSRHLREHIEKPELLPTPENRRPFRCNMCEAKFTTEKPLVKHMEIKHGEMRPFACMEINKGTFEYCYCYRF